MRAVIIGGGIIGLASAYYLSQYDVDVTVLEKSTIGAGSTDRANGGIRAQFSSPVSAALSMESIKVWERFAVEFDTDIEYRRPGYLFLAQAESTAEQFHENVRKQNELGVDSEFLTPQQAKEHCPELHDEQFVGATYCPTDGFADPHLGLQGFSIAANEAGVDIQTKVAVTDVLCNAESVVGVETDAGTIEADYVVNAAGAWAAHVGEMAGLELPVSPKRRQLMVVDPEIPVEEDIPFTIDIDRSVHFRPEREGSAVVGGHFSNEDPDKDPDHSKTKMDLDWAAKTIEEASK